MDCARSVDDSSYTIRFTPRKADSIWSEINTKRVDELTKLGRMQKPGLAAFKARDLEKIATVFLREEQLPV